MRTGQGPAERGRGSAAKNPGAVVSLHGDDPLALRRAAPALAIVGDLGEFRHGVR